jgi:hypothetical protein
MLGNNRGLAGRMKRDVPWIIVIHAVAHKIELAIHDAAKDNTFLTEFEKTLQALYTFYANSPKQTQGLKVCFISLI